MIFLITPDKPPVYQGFSLLSLWKNLWRMWKTPVTHFPFCRFLNNYVNYVFCHMLLENVGAASGRPCRKSSILSKDQCKKAEPPDEQCSPLHVLLYNCKTPRTDVRGAKYVI